MDRRTRRGLNEEQEEGGTKLHASTARLSDATHRSTKRSSEKEILLQLNGSHARKRLGGISMEDGRATDVD